MSKPKLILLAAILVVVAAFILLGGPDLLTLENLQRHQTSLDQWIAGHLLLARAAAVLADGGPLRIRLQG